MNVARRFYEEFHKINPPKLGPYLDPRKVTDDQLTDLKALHRDLWNKIHQDIEQFNNNPIKGEIDVPSPWHAWAFLTQLNITLLATEGKQAGVPEHFPVPVYRGQANDAYPPIPSLYRPTTKRCLEVDKLSAFSFLFDQDFLWENFEIEIPHFNSKAAAQHYGIKTDLLDITADPSVAVYFASTSKDRKRGEWASVFLFDLSKFLEKDVEFIFPPPVVERLYLQVGSFLGFSETDDNLGQYNCKIRFPFDPEFQLMDGLNQREILITDDWFERAVDWSTNWAVSGKPLPKKMSDRKKLISDAYEQIGYPNIYKKYEIPEMVLAHWADNFEDMVYWYAIRIQDDQEGLLSNVVDGITRNNCDLVRFMINLYEIDPTDTDPSKAQLISVWKSSLKRMCPEYMPVL